RIQETSRRWRAAPTGLDPLEQSRWNMVATGPLGGWRGCVTAHSRLGNQVRAFQLKAGEDLAFVADEHHAFGGKLLVVLLQFVWSRRLDPALIPNQIQRRSLPARRILEPHDAGRGIREIVSYGCRYVFHESAVVS